MYGDTLKEMKEIHNEAAYVQALIEEAYELGFAAGTEQGANGHI